MNEILEQALLYDFYGELLTKHQKNIYGQYVLEDYSISEIAAEMEISRQAVHDLIKRSQKILEDYENKLRLVERFINIRHHIQEIDGLLDSYDSNRLENLGDKDTKLLVSKIRRLSGHVMEQL